MPSFKQEEEHAAIVLVKGMLLVLFWASAWGIIDEGVERVQEKLQVSKVKVYATMFLAVVLLFLVFPSLLMKL